MDRSSGPFFLLCLIQVRRLLSAPMGCEQREANGEGLQNQCQTHAVSAEVKGI